MKMKLIFILPILILFSCGGERPVEENDSEISEEKLSMEDLILRKVTADLDIPATENYTLEIKKAQLNDDEFEDAIILVNRKEHAIAKSKEANRTEADSKLGYFGHNNYIFYYDGMMHSVTRPIIVPSSGLIPLKLEFRNIQTQAYYDFTIDTRIQESRWRNFYTIKNGIPKLVFQWHIQKEGEDGELETNHIAYDKGSYSLAKDILIYKAEVLNPMPDDLNSDYELKTKPKGEIVYRFFYNPNEGKYFTKK